MPSRITRRKFLAASAASALAAPLFARAPQARRETQRRGHRGERPRRVEPRGRRAREHRRAVRRGRGVDARRPASSSRRPRSSPTTARCSTRSAKEIDAVVVSTPDHSHALPAALAMNLGKHVYCEKPLTPSVNETRYLRKLAAEKKLVTQMGTQIHAGENYRRVVEIVQAGLLGPVKRVHVWNSSKPVGGKKVDAKPSGEVRYGPLARPVFHRVLRGRHERLAVETCVAALPLALVVGLRRRHARGPRLSLHRSAVLGARPDRPDQRDRDGQEDLHRRQHDPGRDAGGLQVPRDEDQSRSSSDVVSRRQRPGPGREGNVQGIQFRR